MGIGTRILDRNNEVVAIRISSDARIFLVVTFVLAGAAMEIGMLWNHGGAALVFVVVRFVGKFVTLQITHRHLGLEEHDAKPMVVGLMPMSSVAIVLLSDMGAKFAQASPEAYGTLMAAILLMQLLGPLATQFAIKRFGEATLLSPQNKLSPVNNS